MRSFKRRGLDGFISSRFLIFNTVLERFGFDQGLNFNFDDFEFSFDDFFDFFVYFSDDFRGFDRLTRDDDVMRDFKGIDNNDFETCVRHSDVKGRLQMCKG